MLIAYDIRWDTDGDDPLNLKLPTEVEIPEESWDDDRISDYISDTYGFCHYGYKTKRR